MSYDSKSMGEASMFPVSTEIRIATAGGDLVTYVAKPVGDGPWPGVVVIHDAIGMSRDTRNQADWLASEGYFVAAPDLFHGGSSVEMPALDDLRLPDMAGRRRHRRRDCA